MKNLCRDCPNTNCWLCEITKSCKNCEWAGNCGWDDNAVMCEHDIGEYIGEYIPADKLQETAEKCADYVGLKQPHTIEVEK